MTAKDVAGAGVASTLTPLTHDGQRQHHIFLLRGPLLFILSLCYLILPTLLATNVWTQLSISALLLGTLLTVLDLASTVRSRFDDTVKHRLKRALDSIILDDLLRSIFAPDTGWLAVTVGTFVGTAGMYALPLSDEQRVRLFGTGLADLNPDLTGADDARDVLMRPGGVVRLLPQTWRGVLTDDGTAESAAEEEVAVAGEVDDKTAGVGKEHAGRDMEWDDEDEEDEEATVDATDESTSSNEGINLFTTTNNAERRISEDDGDGSNNRDRRAQSTHQASVRRSIYPSPSRPSPQPEDPVAVAASIIAELITNLARRSLQSIDTTSVRTVGLASTAALLLQLRYSKSARGVVWSALQGAASVGFLGVGVGAALVMEARKLSEASSPPASSSSEDEETLADGGRREHTRDPGEYRRPDTNLQEGATRTTTPSASYLMTKLGGDILHTFLSSKSVLVERIIKDRRLRRRLQAAAAFFILMHFRRRRRSKIMHR